MRWAGENDWIPMSLHFLNEPDLRSHWAAYAESSEGGRPRAGPKRWRICRDIYVADTDEQARAEALESSMADAYQQYFFPLMRSLDQTSLWYDNDQMQPDDVTEEHLLATRWVVGSPGDRRPPTAHAVRRRRWLRRAADVVLRLGRAATDRAGVTRWSSWPTRCSRNSPIWTGGAPAMTTNGTSGQNIKQTALDHYLFPLTNADDREDGMMLFTRGEGATLTDVDGNEYLDMMGSGTRATSLGYGQEEIARAVYNQLVGLHYVGTVGNQADVVIQLAAKLADLAPGQLGVSFFVGSGSEANEAAFKLAKQYHFYRGNKPRAHKIISRWNAYHGATMGAQAATDWLGTRHMSEPGVPGLLAHSGPDVLPLSVQSGVSHLQHAVRAVPGAADPARGAGVRRGVHRRAGDAGARRPDPATGVLSDGARHLQEVRGAVHRRRDHHRLRSDRRVVRAEPLGGRAGHHDRSPKR